VTILLYTLSIGLSAVFIGLTVCAVQRRERWATSAAICLLMIIVIGYPLSFGEMCRCLKMGDLPPDGLMLIYAPCGRLAKWGPEIIRRPLVWYVALRIHEEDPYSGTFVVPINRSTFVLVNAKQ
jgi:uncharacterized membrane protein YczE